MDHEVSILIGVVSSLVATFLWFVLSQLYSIRDKKIIDSKLEVAKTSLYEISLKIGYIDDYERVLQQIDRTFDALHDSIDSMKFFTYGFHFHRKKFIITLICNAIRACEIAKNSTVGSSGAYEIKERGRSIAGIFGIDYANCRINNSSQYNLIMIAQYLNGRCGLGYRIKNGFPRLKDKIVIIIGYMFKRRKALLEAARHSLLSNDISEEELKKYLLDNNTLDANSFRTIGTAGIDTVKDKSMTRQEYEKYIQKELRRF